MHLHDCFSAPIFSSKHPSLTLNQELASQVNHTPPPLSMIESRVCKIPKGQLETIKIFSIAFYHDVLNSQVVLKEQVTSKTTGSHIIYEVSRQV